LLLHIIKYSTQNIIVINTTWHWASWCKWQHSRLVYGRRMVQVLPETPAVLPGLFLFLFLLVTPDIQSPATSRSFKIYHSPPVVIYWCYIVWNIFRW
jgi:hypothetical protein